MRLALGAWLALALLGCGPGETRLALSPVDASPREAAPACFGGREVSRDVIRDAYELPPGWVLGRVELGRCAGDGGPVDLTARMRRGAFVYELGSLRLERGAAQERRIVELLVYQPSDGRIELEAAAADGTDAFLVGLHWIALPARPRAFPATLRHVLAGEIVLDEAVVTVAPPAQVRLRAEPGLHTLSGQWGPVSLVEAPPQLNVVAPGRGRGPHASWSASAPGLAPFTVTFAARERDLVDLWLVGDPARPLRLRELRHDAVPQLWAEPPARVAPSAAPTPPAPTLPALDLSAAEARASGYNESAHHDSYAPARAVDGDPRTEWHSPDGEPGWLELRLASPVTLRAVGLLNGHNPGYDDRGTRALTLEAFAGDALVGRVEGTLDGAAGQTSFELHGAGVDRVRVTPRTYVGHGAAIAEVVLH